MDKRIDNPGILQLVEGGLSGIKQTDDGYELYSKASPDSSSVRYTKDGRKVIAADEVYESDTSVYLYVTMLIKLYAYYTPGSDRSRQLPEPSRKQ